MLGTLLVVLLILALLGALPRWPHSRNWGYYPTGGLGLILCSGCHTPAPWPDLTIAIVRQRNVGCGRTYARGIVQSSSSRLQYLRLRSTCGAQLSAVDTALAHAPRSAGAVFRCGDRFLRDSSRICCSCGSWRTMEILGCWQPMLSLAASWADTRPGISAAGVEKRPCAITCPSAFSVESWAGWSATVSSPCFFQPYFLRRFRSYHLRWPAARWGSHAGASWLCTARHAPCVTHSLHGSGRSTDAESYACGQAACRNGQRRCYACSLDSLWPASALDFGTFEVCVEPMPLRNLRRTIKRF